jgi:hypothetical protein
MGSGMTNPAGAYVAAAAVRMARAVHTSAVRAGADLDRLLDSEEFAARLTGLEPLATSPAFEDVVGAVVADFVAGRPHLRPAGGAQP